jgi:hypothetical protein
VQTAGTDQQEKFGEKFLEGEDGRGMGQNAVKNELQVWWGELSPLNIVLPPWPERDSIAGFDSGKNVSPSKKRAGISPAHYRNGEVLAQKVPVDKRTQRATGASICVLREVNDDGEV